MRRALALTVALLLAAPPAYAAGSAVLSAVGDLDGDGRDDLLTSGSHSEYTVVGSRTGRVLWGRTVPRVLDIQPLRLGGRGNGVVFVSYRVVDSTQGTYATYETTFLTVDGHGLDVWKHAFTWRQVSSRYDVRGPLPQIVGVGRLVGDPAEDLLVRTWTRAFNGGSYAWSGSTVVLDGASGAVHEVGGTDAGASTYEQGSLVGSGPVEPALVGSRVVSGSVSEQGAAVVTAYRLGEGMPDWVATPRVSIYSGIVRSLGDVTGDRTADVVLLPVNDFKPTELAVLSGADGHVVFAGPGLAAFPQRAGEVTVAGVVSDARGTTVTWTTVNSAGTVLRRVTTRVPSSIDAEWTTASVTPAGDVQGDGYTDAVVDVRFSNRDGDRDARRAVVDGRTGRALWWSRDAVVPFGRDVLGVDGSVAGRLRVVRRDGATGRVTWSRSVPFSGYAGHDMSVASLDGDRVPDVIVTPFSNSRIGSVALAGATGRVLARAGAVG